LCFLTEFTSPYTLRGSICKYMPTNIANPWRYIAIYVLQLLWKDNSSKSIILSTSVFIHLWFYFPNRFIAPYCVTKTHFWAKLNKKFSKISPPVFVSDAICHKTWNTCCHHVLLRCTLCVINFIIFTQKSSSYVCFCITLASNLCWYFRRSGDWEDKLMSLELLICDVGGTWPLRQIKCSLCHVP